LLVIPILAVLWFAGSWPLGLPSILIYGASIALLSILPVIINKYSYDNYYIMTVTLVIIEILFLIIAANPISEIRFLYIMMPIISIIYFDRVATMRMTVLSYFGMILVEVFRFMSYDTFNITVKGFSLKLVETTVEYLVIFTIIYLICSRYEKFTKSANDDLMSELMLMKEEDINKSKTFLFGSDLYTDVYDVEQLFSSVRNNLVGIIKGKEKTISVEIDADLPIALVGKTDKIKESISNICSDLLLYHTKANVDLYVTYDKGMVPKKNGNIYLILQIKSDVDVINNEINKKALGYFLSKKIVEELKGYYEESFSENETFFEIRLLQKVEDEITVGTRRKNQQDALVKAESVSKQYETNHIYYDQRRVLVVDDNKATRKLIDAILTPMGIVTESADSGISALEMIQSSFDYDLIILDYMMPDKSGIETIKELRNLVDDYFKKIPVILMAINNKEEFKKEYLDVGFTDSISKPLNQTELISSIHKVLKEDFPITYEEYLHMNTDDEVKE